MLSCLFVKPESVHLISDLLDRMSDTSQKEELEQVKQALYAGIKALNGNTSHIDPAIKLVASGFITEDMFRDLYPNVDPQWEKGMRSSLLGEPFGIVFFEIPETIDQETAHQVLKQLKGNFRRTETGLEGTGLRGKMLNSYRKLPAGKKLKPFTSVDNFIHIPEDEKEAQNLYDKLIQGYYPKETTIIIYKSESPKQETEQSPTLGEHKG